MNYCTVQALLVHILVCVLAFEDVIYVYGDGSHEMLEQGRSQYQLIRERSTLPQYGTCWKLAVQHIDESCRHLSDDTQSDVALHLTNCFLAMSGHEIYNCELDKKPNLRGICINSMSDRAFNVYTEFYTHTQNMCWFLRGQIWQETVMDNSLKVGEQLKTATENQEHLLQAQKASLDAQEKMLNNDKLLKQTLEDLYVTTTAYQDVLKATAQAVSSMQAWIVGEVSWLDSMVFYGGAIMFIFISTSAQRTASSRLPLMLVLVSNFAVERIICHLILASGGSQPETSKLYGNVSFYIWCSRYVFVFVGCILLLYCAYLHQDLALINNELLMNIHQQNVVIMKALALPNSPAAKWNVINEGGRQYLQEKLNNFNGGLNGKSKNVSPSNIINNNLHGAKNANAGQSKQSNRWCPLSDLQSFRYNLRSRQGTPES